MVYCSLYIYLIMYLLVHLVSVSVAEPESKFVGQLGLLLFQVGKLVCFLIHINVQYEIRHIFKFIIYTADNNFFDAPQHFYCTVCKTTLRHR